MNITFLYHSAFLVELDTCSLLFDWYGGTVPDYDRPVSYTHLTLPTSDLV